MMERAGKMRLQGTASRTTVQDVVEAKLAALCNITTIHGNVQSLTHRRRMEREAKAKVVASVWVQNFFNFLPR